MQPREPQQQQVIERDGDHEHQAGEQIAAQHVAWPMLAFQHTRGANKDQEVETDDAHAPEQRRPPWMIALEAEGQINRKP